MFKPSAEQTAIFEAIENTNDNIMVDAGPGSGKTTTAVEALKSIPSDKKVVFLAFNKSIANELQERAPKHVECATLNSMGFQICAKFIRKYIKIDTSKTTAILRFQVLKVKKGDVEAEKYYYSIQGAVKQLVSLAKGALIFNPTRKDFEDLADTYGVELSKIDPDQIDMFYANLLATFKLSCNYSTKFGDKTIITMDFDDQIFMPLYHKMPIPEYDFVFIDESQDLNKAQIELVIKLAGN